MPGRAARQGPSASRPGRGRFRGEKRLKGMVVTLSTRADFTLDNFARVAWRGAPVALAGEALARIETSRAAFLALLDRDPPPVIYGVTTGYGQRASRRLAGDERRAHAPRPPLPPGPP